MSTKVTPFLSSLTCVATEDISFEQRLNQSELKKAVLASGEGISMLLHNNITAEQPLTTVLLSINTPLNWPRPAVK